MNPAWLIRFLPHIAIAGALVGAWLWHLSEVREARQDERRAVVAEYDKRLAKQREADLQRHQESNRAWQSQLADLQRQSVTVLPQPVRLCVSAPSLPAADPVAGTADAGVGREHVVQASGDLGPALREYGAECERYRRALKQAQRDASL